MDEMGLSESDAAGLTDDKDVADFFEMGLMRHNNAKVLANWVLNEVLRELKGQSIGELLFDGSQLGELIALIDDDTISGKIAKEVFCGDAQVGAKSIRYR